MSAERGRFYRSRAAFARAAGVGARTLGDVERARRDNYSDATLAAIEAALGWEPGTCKRIVAGGKVRRDIDPQVVRLLDAWATLGPDARVLLLELAERAAQQRNRR